MNPASIISCVKINQCTEILAFALTFVFPWESFDELLEQSPARRVRVIAIPRDVLLEIGALM